LFCNNLFGNPRLFSLLQDLGIGACGTARRQVTNPVFGNIDKWKAAWGDLCSKVVTAFPELQDPTCANKPVLVCI
jgi:hypothetical protein